MSACPNCTASDLAQIDLSPQGRPMRFSTCRTCEHRWWTDSREADTVSLADVLNLVAAA